MKKIAIFGAVMAAGFSISTLAFATPQGTVYGIQDESRKDTGFAYTEGCIKGMKHAIVFASNYTLTSGNKNFAITPIIDAEGKPVACESAK